MTDAVNETYTIYYWFFIVYRLLVGVRDTLHVHRSCLLIRSYSLNS